MNLTQLYKIVLLGSLISLIFSAGCTPKTIATATLPYDDSSSVKSQKTPKSFRKVDGEWVELSEEEAIAARDKKADRQHREKILPNHNNPDSINNEEAKFLEKLEDSKLVNVVSQFAAGSRQPIMEGDSLLKSLVEKINISPENTYVLVGHTNSQGSAISNIKLSLNRAIATKAILEKEYGLDTTKLHFGGAGESLPMHNNATAVGRKKKSREERPKMSKMLPVSN